MQPGSSAAFAAGHPGKPGSSRQSKRSPGRPAGAKPRLLRPGGGAALRSAAAAHRRGPRRPQQQQRQHGQVLLLSQGRDVVPVHPPVRRPGRDQASRRLRSDRKPAALRRQVLVRYHRQHLRHLRELSPQPGRRSHHQARDDRRSSRRASTLSSPADGRRSTSRSTSGPSATCCWSKPSRQAWAWRAGSSARTASCGTAASRLRSPSLRFRHAT